MRLGQGRLLKTGATDSAEDRETVNNSRNRARGARGAVKNRSNSIGGSWTLLKTGATAFEEQRAVKNRSNSIRGGHECC